MFLTYCILTKSKLQRRKYFLKLLQISKKFFKIFTEKKSACKWNSTVQTCVVQGSAIKNNASQYFIQLDKV